MTKMDIFLYSGVAVVAGTVITFGYRLIRKMREQSEPKNDAMSKISEFYASQNNDLNY